MREKTIEYIYGKEIIDVVESGALIVDTSNGYESGRYLHDGIITFNNVFPELHDSYVQIVKIELLEQVRDSGNLLKLPVYLYLFNACKALPTIDKNSLFAYSDIFDSTYPLELNFQQVLIGSSSYIYEYIDASNNIKDAKAEVFPQNLFLRSNGSQHIFGVAVTAGATSVPYAASARVKFLLWVKLL